ncbi:hypothetical protein BDN67DRAFT_1009634 [Paxillus ammoniavirescens]|nr:hypothetical protein BDN67DRAFT_1009634 [Paxillus ammoniavirescens]
MVAEKRGRVDARCPGLPFVQTRLHISEAAEKTHLQASCSKANTAVDNPTIAPIKSTLPPAVTVPSPDPLKALAPTPLAPLLSPEPAVANLAEVVPYARWAKDHRVKRVCEGCGAYSDTPFPGRFVVVDGNYKTAAYLECGSHNRNRGTHPYRGTMVRRSTGM